MTQTEIQTIRALPIEAVAERLGLSVRRHKSLCPFHDDSHPSLSFKAGSYRCFACGAHGGVIDLAMHMLGRGFADTCRWLADEHNIILTKHQPADKPPAGRQTATFDAARYARIFEHPYLSDAARRFLFDERHIHPRVASFCRLNSWRDRNGTNWLQIPYYNVDGMLIGIQNRNLDYRHPPAGNSHAEAATAPRFRFPYGSRCGIYNLPVLRMLAPSEPLFITEGASDCWAMLSSGHKAIAIPSATLLNGHDFKLLSGLNLHMYPDNDTPGEQLYWQIVRAANEVGASITRHQLPEGCKDFAEKFISNT